MAPGVVQAKDPLYTDVLNARTLSIAEKQGLDVLTICGTCTGYMRKARHRLGEDEARKEKVNRALAITGETYQGTADVVHLQWILDKLGPEALAQKVTKPLSGKQIAPFYGCHIIRPSKTTGHDDPDNPQSLERIIRALGAEPVDYSHRLSCCGFPIFLEREDAAHRMTADSVAAAHTAGAHAMVTPCPLCHIKLGHAARPRPASRRRLGPGPGHGLVRRPNPDLPPVAARGLGRWRRPRRARPQPSLHRGGWDWAA